MAAHVSFSLNRSQIDRYTSQIPQNLARVSTDAFSSILVVSVIFSNWKQGVVNGTLSVLATLVGGVASPALRSVFNHSRELSFQEGVARRVVGIFLVAGVASVLGYSAPLAQVSTSLFWAVISEGVSILVNPQERSPDRMLPVAMWGY